MRNTLLLLSVVQV